MLRFTAYCFPYIVSLMPKTSYLEVHSWQNERTQPLVQQIQVEKGASCLCDGVLGTKDEDKGRNPVGAARGPRCVFSCNAVTPWMVLPGLLRSPGQGHAPSTRGVRAPGSIPCAHHEDG